jgi:hypothetical protein
MLPLSVIDDPNVLRNPCALNSLSACRISYSPYQTNADDPPLNGCSDLCDHPSRRL